MLWKAGKKQKSPACQRGFSRTPAGGRTLDTLIKSQVLYQLSYGSIILWVQKYNLFRYDVYFSATFFLLYRKILYINAL